PIVGHQVNFDVSFLEYHYRKMYNEFGDWENRARRFKYVKNRRLDTLFLARIFLPFSHSLKLGAVAAYFNHPIENAHRAVEDARATGLIFIDLLDKALNTNNNILSDIINLLYANSPRAKTFFVPILNFKKQNNIAMSDTALIDEATETQTYFNIIGESERTKPDSGEAEDIRFIEEETISAYFDDKGKLSKLLDKYEKRPQQHEMADAVSKAFNDSHYLIAEAGTGTGKSMAYLIPAIEWAMKNRVSGERVIISTNTKNLQEQLFFKDLPMLYSASGGGFKAVLLKGRANYLCLDKWQSVLTDKNQRLSPDERSRILPLMVWMAKTKTGDISENPGFQIANNMGLWQKLIAEHSYCPGKACKYYKDCFLMKARNEARKADVVVVNHALLFSDLASDNSILGPYRNLIVDEAHNIEKTAADHLGSKVNFWSFRNLYHKLYEEEQRKNGLLAQLDFRLNKKGIDHQIQNSLSRLSDRLQHHSTYLKQSVNQFYNDLSRELRQKYASEVKQGDARIRYYKNFKFFKELDFVIDDINKLIKKIRFDLKKSIDIFDEISEKNVFDFQDQIHREFISVESDFAHLQEDFDFCLNADEDKYVYWFELPRNERSNDVLLRAVPLNIAELLQKHLYEQVETAVFTSATLTTNSTFKYFEERIGLTLLQEKGLERFSFGSPFDFEKQLLFSVTDFIDDPRNENFSGQLTELIKEIHTHHKKGMLVLFTNYSLLNMLYEKLKPHFDEQRILLLAQGKSGSRTNIINQFKENNDSILFGTDSFWEGIDVPGDALQILLIPKLPFDVPSEPLVAARMDEIKKRGGNAFFEYSVPEAIMKFRQGFGRLIRNSDDFGVVISTDNRLSKMAYGKQFINSLPVKAEIHKSKEALFESLDKWFGN
ncbi:DEAD/DEAH box helicase, partial [bacterium]|nr:DEAD/DEAH box helicase [bacterium]